MRAILPLAAAGVAVGALAATAFAAPATTERAARQMERMLSGKTPGEPQDCIWLREIDGTTIIDSQTILYRERRDTVYRNEIPDGGCPGLQNDRAFATMQPSDVRLCEGETIRVFDPQTGVEYGTCSIGEFTPYRS